MSAVPQYRTKCCSAAHVRFVPKADIARLAWNERGHQLRRPTFLWAVAGPGLFPRPAASRLAAAAPYLSVAIIAPVGGANIHGGRSVPGEPPIGRTTLVLYSALLMRGDLMKRGLERFQV